MKYFFICNLLILLKIEGANGTPVITLNAYYYCYYLSLFVFVFCPGKFETKCEKRLNLFELTLNIQVGHPLYLINYSYFCLKEQVSCLIIFCLLKQLGNVYNNFNLIILMALFTIFCVWVLLKVFLRKLFPTKTTSLKQCQDILILEMGGVVFSRRLIL